MYGSIEEYIIFSVICEDDDLLWKCDNGECIRIEDICDGKIDCEDGSDETVKNCIGTECGRVSFACTYGACVAGSAVCNGTKECADGSDESPALCQKHLWETKLRGNCKHLEMQCKSGECIPSEDKCDGHRDCEDGSDEELETCSAQNCFPKPPKSFRCGYGACVSGTAKCNSIQECPDGSDESSVLCGRDVDRTCNSNSNSHSDSNSFVNKSTTLIPPMTTISDRGSCRVPQQGIDDLIVENLLFPDRIIYSSVVDSTPIKYKCRKGFRLNGVSKNICIGTQWQYEWPKCFRCCSDTHPKSGYSTSVTFTLDGVVVSGSECLEPNTIAIFQCVEGFKQPDQGFVLSSRCLDGKWTRYKQQCLMDCGRPILPFTQFSHRGVSANITDHPWHVGIYFENGGNYTQICTGSLISPRRVVTAAHCFFGDSEVVLPSKFSQNSPYLVVAGKKYRDFNYPETGLVIKRKIINIWIPNEFTGRQSFFVNDVAIATLGEYAPLSSYTRPVCVLYPDLDRRRIPEGVRGQFTAWNRVDAENRISSLEKVPGVTIDFNICSQRIYELSQYYIPHDKFCVKMDNVAKVCKGDSGSGFIVQDPVTKQYQLYGVVSFSPQRTQDCSLDDIVLMTNVLDVKEIVTSRQNDTNTEINYDIN